MNKQQQLLPDNTYHEGKQSNQFEKLKSDLECVQQFLKDTKVHHTRDEIKEILFNNLKKYYVAKSLTKKINGDISGDWNTSDAGIFKISIDDIPDEIVEVVYEVYNVVDNFPIKSLKLYTGAFKEPLFALFKKHPEYCVEEFFRELSNNSLTDLYKVALKRVKAGYDGNKSLYQVTKSIRELGEILELSNSNNGQQNINGGVVLNLNVNGGK